ncbi:trypsin-like peptidase domain-containing protein [Pelagicoccus sp. SDUM812003]|uniref:S1C family serine protease n=1 Tax=Pelagicoccus sp. SDUM812003 TaxID=3041267 RepID=UPI0028103B6A|nr:trypsin-like peptidase domain-containing protein [Pelagicoccus sp. SDUM812003]MDQ8202098.1 trypsin-like peptidase domain-containing protein [Pelagicoccus sp. SDUM812003]
MSNSSKPYRFVFPFLLFAICVFLVTYVANYLFEETHQGTRDGARSGGPTDQTFLPGERNTIEVFQKASPAVVFVHNIQNQFDIRTWTVSEIPQNTGSGFLWDARGHIVTNYHVVQQADRIAVTLIDGNTYEAVKVGVEPSKDLAVLKIDLVETNVTPLGELVADSSKILVGQKSIAIGNPFGLDHTLTVGTISALGRSMTSIVKNVTIRDMIQTDAAINPGNSGGPLLDSKGRLIGMNTLILRDSTGIGFAVPSNTIKRIVGQIIEFGRPIRSGIGVTVFSDQSFAGLASRLGIEGVLLREVLPGSPAEKAGLQGTTRDRMGRIVLGDVLQGVNGAPIRNVDDLYHAFDLKKAGEQVEIVFYRQGKQYSVTTQIQEIDSGVE